MLGLIVCLAMPRAEPPAAAVEPGPAVESSPAAPNPASHSDSASDSVAPAPTPPNGEPTPASAPAAQEALLILATRTMQIEPAWGAQVTHELARAAGRYPRLRVVTSQDLRELNAYLESQQLLGCEETSCLAQVAKLSAARWLLVSSLGRVGARWVLNVSLIDSHTAEPSARANRTAENLDGLIAAAESAVGEILGDAAGAARYQHKAGKFSCAVIDLRPNGVPPEVADNLTQVLSTAIKTLDGAQVISKDDIAAMLDAQAQSQMMGCDDTACMAELGGALGVDKLVVGSVGQLGTAYVISLRLVDIATSSVDNRVTESFSAAAEQLLGAIRKAAFDLFGVEAASPGEIIMSVSEAGATVFVDDRAVGETPMPKIGSLPPGRHRVRVSKDGFFVFTTELYVEPGATTGQWVQLEEIPEPWYEKWWIWTGAAVVVAGGITTAILLSQPRTGTLEIVSDVPTRYP